MDERTGQFFISVGHLCEDAALARLMVRVATTGNRIYEGVPDPPRAGGERDLDDTGYEDGLRIDGWPLRLHDVVEISISLPDPPEH